MKTLTWNCQKMLYHAQKLINPMQSNQGQDTLEHKPNALIISMPMSILESLPHKLDFDNINVYLLTQCDISHYTKDDLCLEHVNKLAKFNCCINKILKITNTKCECYHCSTSCLFKDNLCLKYGNNLANKKF